MGCFLRPCRIFQRCVGSSDGVCWIFRHVQKDLQNSNFNSQARNFRQCVGTCNCESEHSQSPWEDPHRNFQRGSEVPTVSRNMHSVRNISPEPVGTLDRNFRQRPEVPTQCRNMYLFLGLLTEPLGTSTSEVLVVLESFDTVSDLPTLTGSYDLVCRKFRPVQKPLQISIAS